MKLALQIAAGILIASGLLWLGGMVLMAGAVRAVDDTLSAALKTASASARDAAAVAQARLERQHGEEAAMAATRAQQQAARCVVHTADGRELHCDARGSLRPR